MTLRYRLAAFLSLVALGLTLGLHASGVAPTNVLNTAADLAGKTLVTAEGNRTITGTFSWNVPVRLNPGTTSAPGLVSTSDQTTGLQLSVGSISGSLSGTQRWLLNASGLALFGVQTINSSGVAQVVGGGTGLTGGTSGGVLYYTGGTTIASSAALTQYGVMYGGGAGGAPTVVAPCTTGQALGGVTGAAPTCQSAGMFLLKANSGTDTSAGATNVDTLAVTGLTAKDQLLVYVVLKSVTQDTGAVSLYSTTDSVALETISGGIVATETQALTNHVMASQAATTTYTTWTDGISTSVGTLDKIAVTAMTTAFTGSWTLALRHAGVTAGGTLQWQWTVYKLSGQ